MSENDQDDELTRDLTAPGTPAELSQEDRYRAMFREAGPGSSLPDVVPLRRSRRRLSRAGAGTAIAVAAALTTGGVAAASTGSLPTPLQTFAHRVIPFVADEPQHDKAKPTDRAGDEPSPSATATSSTPPPTATPPTSTSPATAPPTSVPTSADPTTPGGRPSTSRPGADPTTAGPSATSTPTPTHTPTTTPTATASTPTTTPDPTSPVTTPATPTTTPTATTSPIPPAAMAARVTISAPGHQVPYQSTTTLSGEVTDADGGPVAGVKVVLQRKGPQHWLPVTSTDSDASGGVAFTTGPVTETTTYRLHIHHDHSAPFKVAMLPSLTATATLDQRTVTVTVTTQGGQPGDPVAIVTHRHGRLHVVAHGVLGDDGSTTLTFEAKKRGPFTAVLDKTEAHTRAKASVELAQG